MVDLFIYIVLILYVFIAGIKEGLYSVEALAAYLLYRLNVINPTGESPSLFSLDSGLTVVHNGYVISSTHCIFHRGLTNGLTADVTYLAPAYLTLLPEGSSPTNDLAIFLQLLAKRMNMIKRGGEADIERATVYFIKWWREEGGLLSASSGTLRLGSDDISVERQPINGLGAAGDPLVLPQTQAWGFDFQWELRPEDVLMSGRHLQSGRDTPAAGGVAGIRMRDPMDIVQDKMEWCIDDHMRREEAERDIVSPTQVKKRLVLAEKERRKAKWSAKQKG